MDVDSELSLDDTFWTVLSERPTFVECYKCRCEHCQSAVDVAGAFCGSCVIAGCADAC